MNVFLKIYLNFYRKYLLSLLHLKNIHNKFFKNIFNILEINHYVKYNSLNKIPLLSIRNMFLKYFVNTSRIFLYYKCYLKNWLNEVI